MLLKAVQRLPVTAPIIAATAVVVVRSAAERLSVAAGTAAVVDVATPPRAKTRRADPRCLPWWEPAGEFGP